MRPGSETGILWTRKEVGILAVKKNHLQRPGTGAEKFHKRVETKHREPGLLIAAAAQRTRGLSEMMIDNSESRMQSCSSLSIPDHGSRRGCV